MRAPAVNGSATAKTSASAVYLLIAILSLIAEQGAEGRMATAMRTSGTKESGRGLAIQTSPIGKRYLTYDGAPLFAFGPGDEARLLSGTADLERWAAWQRAHGMNLVRAYPMSVPAQTWGDATPGLDPFLRSDGKWDVDAWNDDYFDHLHRVARYLEKNDIVLHLQLWQIVFFKNGSTRWDANFLNPANNVNQWTRVFNSGHDYIDAPPESYARRHQREWVRRILNAVKGRGNVIIDVINELGNQMGTLKWAGEIVGWIREWESENDWTFIVGVDSEVHYRPGRFEPYQGVFDIIILNELRSRNHAMSVIDRLKMPAVSVRSSDGTNRREDVLFADSSQTGPEHQTRYRTLCYRSMFSGLQSVGAYWKMPATDYERMDLWNDSARALRAFWDLISHHWLELVIDDAVVVEAVTPNAYAMRSPKLTAVYLECGSHTWANDYPESALVLRSPYPSFRVTLFDTKTGTSTPLTSESHGELVRVNLPSFTDDVALLLISTE
jgi:hypothetical protein